MFVQRFFVEGLAHASYLFGSDGEGAVVDPKRDVHDYLVAAEALQVKIVAIFETHPHADFVSGHLDLAAATGAPVYVSEKYPAAFPHKKLAHGDSVRVGSAWVTGLHTPGHSPDSMSFYFEDGDDRGVFSGDILFVGDVGRPDLRDMHADPGAMAGALYDTLRDVIWKLPDETVVYPAHGAGSLCGRRLGAQPTTLIGVERRENWANRFESREAFVEAMLANLPDRPIFFYNSPFVNIAGPRPLSDVPHPQRLTAAEASRPGEALVLDLRAAECYAAAHLAGSVNVGIDAPVFSTWVGTLAGPDRELIVIVDRPEDAERAWLDLARIGYERLTGYHVAEPAAWRQSGASVRETPMLDACCVDEWANGGRVVLDVRTSAERSAGAIPNDIPIPLAKLATRMSELPAGPVAVLCGGGYRAAIGAGLLEAAGRSEVAIIRGGWAAYSRRTCPEPDAQDLSCGELLHRMQSRAA